jgi:hypothetical protein
MDYVRKEGRMWGKMWGRIGKWVRGGLLVFEIIGFIVGACALFGGWATLFICGVSWSSAISLWVSELWGSGKLADKWCSKFDRVMEWIEYGTNRKAQADHSNPGTGASAITSASTFGTSNGTFTLTLPALPPPSASASVSTLPLAQRQQMGQNHWTAVMRAVGLGTLNPVTAVNRHAKYMALLGLRVNEADNMEVIKEPVPILAKRAVRINFTTGKIYSVSQGGELTHVMQAKCDQGFDQELGTEWHKAPEVNCSCGFYAVVWNYPYENSYIGGRVSSAYLPSSGTGTRLGHWAEVELWGTVIECGEDRKVEGPPKTLYIPADTPKMEELVSGSLEPDEYLTFTTKEVYAYEYRALGYRSEWQRIIKVHVNFEGLGPSTTSRLVKGFSTYSQWQERLLLRLGECNPGIKFVKDTGELNTMTK